MYRGTPDQHRVARRPDTIWRLAATTPLAILPAHYLAVLPHECMHSFVAWASGFKSDPFDIHWGGGSPGNILLLYNIDEKVDYKAAYAAGKGASVAAAVLAGPGTNAVLYLLIRFAAPLWRTSTRPHVAHLAFWFQFMQLANVYDYVPVRVAASDGDVGQWVRATHMSPWLIYVVVGYLVLWAMIDLVRVHCSDVDALDSCHHLGELASHRHPARRTGHSSSSGSLQLTQVFVDLGRLVHHGELGGVRLRRACR